VCENALSFDQVISGRWNDDTAIMRDSSGNAKRETKGANSATLRATRKFH